MTKRLCLLLLVLLIALTGCKQRPPQDGDNQGANPSSGESIPDPEIPDADPDEPPETEEPEEEIPETPSVVIEGTPNSAVNLITGADVLGDYDDALFLLIRYGADMQWMEANRIDNLERGTPTATGEPYYLLIPKFVGSEVAVQELVVADGANVPTPGQRYYLKENTPDNYGLVLTNSEPEGIPNLQVTVTYDEYSYSYRFTYDGRGDRPAMQVLTPEGQANS